MLHIIYHQRNKNSNNRAYHYTQIRISSVQSLSRVRLSATPWTAAHQASLSITNSQSLLKLMSIESVMPSNHLIPLSSPSPPASNLQNILNLRILTTPNADKDVGQQKLLLIAGRNANGTITQEDILAMSYKTYKYPLTIHYPEIMPPCICPKQLKILSTQKLALSNNMSLRR